MPAPASVELHIGGNFCGLAGLQALRSRSLVKKKKNTSDHSSLLESIDASRNMLGEHPNFGCTHRVPISSCKVENNSDNHVENADNSQMRRLFTADGESKLPRFGSHLGSWYLFTLVPTSIAWRMRTSSKITKNSARFCNVFILFWTSILHGMKYLNVFSQLLFRCFVPLYG